VDCESACVDGLQTAFLNAVDSPNKNSLSLILYPNHFPNFSFPCLIDCGSSHCFLDEKFAKDNCFPVTPISPMRLKLIDGSYGPPLTRVSDVTVTLSCGLVHNIRFLLTHLDHEFPAVLGLDWLTQHNPLIDWVTSSVTFRNCLRSTPGTETESETLSAMANTLLSEDEISDDTLSESSDNDDSFDQSDSETNTLKSIPASPEKTSSFKAPHISIISANAFMKALKTEGTRCYSISVHESIEAKSRSATASSGSFRSNMEGVPDLYHGFADVFSKVKADTLAPH
jgi:Retroviral aspartyl protease